MQEGRNGLLPLLPLSALSNWVHPGEGEALFHSSWLFFQPMICIREKFKTYHSLQTVETLPLGLEGKSMMNKAARVENQVYGSYSTYFN